MPTGKSSAHAEIVPIPHSISGFSLPVLFAPDADAGRRFFEFFTPTSAIPTRDAPMPMRRENLPPGASTTVCGGLRDIEPVHITAYIEDLQQRFATPSVEQDLAAIRMLFEAYLHAYIEGSGLASHGKGYLFRMAPGHTGLVTDKPMCQSAAWRMIRRRAVAAGTRCKQLKRGNDHLSRPG
jgi:hypothetical protein